MAESRAQPPPLPAVEVVVDREWKPAALALIDGATTSVDVFHFELHETGSVVEIRDAVEAAHARGVAVRVMLDDEVGGNFAVESELAALGIEAKVDRHDTRLHIKVIVADGVALFGSTNLSGASLDFNREANVLVRHEPTVAILSAWLDELWADPGLDPTLTNAGDDVIRLWRDGGYLGVAAPAMEAATGRIDVVMYGVNLNPRFPDGPVAVLAGYLYDAAARGARVRVLLERSDWDEGLTALNEQAAQTMTAQGVEVRFDALDVTTHAKVVIADDTVLLGSNNWSFTGLELAHEVGARFDDPAAVASLSAWFEARWAEGQ